MPYNPVEPDDLYLSQDDLAGALAVADPIRLSAYGVTDAANNDVFNLELTRGRNFAQERASGDVNVFQAAVDHIGRLRAGGKRVILAAWTEGSRERLTQVVEEHGLEGIKPVESLEEGQRGAEEPRRHRGPRHRVRLRDAAISRSSASRTSSATGWCAAAAASGAARTSSPRSPASTRATSSSMSTTASAASSG